MNTSTQGLRQFWRDDLGFIVSAELILILTIGVLGTVVGLTCARTAVVQELQDVSYAFRSLNQSFGFTGFRGCFKPGRGFTSWKSGSAYVDQTSVVCDDVTSDFAYCVPESPREAVPVPVPAPQLAPIPETVAPPAAPACPPGRDCCPECVPTPTPTPAQPSVQHFEAPCDNCQPHRGQPLRSVF